MLIFGVLCNNEDPLEVCLSDFPSKVCCYGRDHPDVYLFVLCGPKRQRLRDWCQTQKTSFDMRQCCLSPITLHNTHTHNTEKCIQVLPLSVKPYKKNSPNCLCVCMGVCMRVCLTVCLSVCVSFLLFLSFLPLTVSIIRQMLSGWDSVCSRLTRKLIQCNNVAIYTSIADVPHDLVEQKPLGLALNKVSLQLRARKGKKFHPPYWEAQSRKLRFTHSPLLSTNHQTLSTIWEVTSFVYYVQYNIYILTVLLVFVQTNNSLHTSH